MGVKGNHNDNAKTEQHGKVSKGEGKRRISVKRQGTVTNGGKKVTKTGPESVVSGTEKSKKDGTGKWTRRDVAVRSPGTLRGRGAICIRDVVEFAKLTRRRQLSRSSGL